MINNFIGKAVPYKLISHKRKGIPTPFEIGI